jgi:hypothetical protein
MNRLLGGYSDEELHAINHYLEQAVSLTAGAGPNKADGTTASAA